MKTFITSNAKHTKKLGELLAEEIKLVKRFNLSQSKQPDKVERQNAIIICLSGDLGSGKTTFAQGFLKGLGIKGPHMSPTFLVMKHYKKKIQNPKSKIRNKFKIQNSKFKILNIYHIDAYRVKAKDILNLGWKEIISGDNIVLVEWADRIKKIIPRNALWIKFKWMDRNRRRIIFK